MNDATLWDRFTEGTLPAAEWTHTEHLRMAWMFLERHSLDEAHVLMRVGIIRLNAAHGLVETPERGYHDTLTRAWLALVAACRRESRATSTAEFLTACRDRLAKDAPLRHYSRERLLSVEARARFVEPDIVPLPAR